ncbi:MAG: acyl-CoA dehydrogenase family protein [Deltaproteobacteria bacterium]|nr:acyl-CoA dehydrogenase family protein [Deltaproteobacteria bacterium]MCB9785948.1 acyl-CoA dehydrogenase family protein [Deltaproteobacteria bacterium]
MGAAGQAEAARAALAAARGLVSEATLGLARAVASGGRVAMERLDERQIEGFALAQLLALVEGAAVMLDHAEAVGGELSAGLAAAMAAEAVQAVEAELRARPGAWGLTRARVDEALAEGAPFVEAALSSESWRELAVLVRAQGTGPHGLDDERDMVRREFRRFAEGQVVPRAEQVHRHDELVPREIIDAVAELGCFGLSIPERFGGLQPDDAPDNIGMCVVTEELSRGSLGVAGSLITRPEILSKALLMGGTEAQKERWLPRLASGETMCAVAVTEPDFGSNVAGMKVAATRTEGGWLLNGQKTWCTFAGFADVLMVLARTDPDPAAGHRGLSILLAEKPRFEGHTFEHSQPGGGRISGRAIDTIGYRGMHSFDVFFEDYLVPADHVIGGDGGLGKGFYFQMEGFAGGRLQTAARATGVMQAALDQALTYAAERKVFGQPIAEYALTAWKLARMAMIVQTARQFTYAVARRLDRGEGHVEAALVKLWASRQAEWVTREAMQIHGGMGYAEEYDVSRYFLDARVFSIFEGAEEVLALRVVARQVLQAALEGGGAA